MSSLKSLVKAAGIVFGSIGLVACIAGMVALWFVSARLERVTESSFSTIDRALLTVRQRVVQTRDRVATGKITTEDIEKTLQSWTEQEARQRVVLQLATTERTEQLMSVLRQADLWLEISASSMGLAKEILSITDSMSAQTDTPLDQLVAGLESSRAQLAKATELIAGIRERITEASDEKSPEQRIKQAAQLTRRVVASLGSLDSRLEELGGRLSDVQDQLHGLKARIRWWIRLAATGVTLLILWMAIGQLALCRIV